MFDELGLGRTPRLIRNHTGHAELHLDDQIVVIPPAEALAFLDAGPVRAFGDYVASFDRAPASLHGALAAAGFEALWVDVTTPDVAEVGLHVVRSLVPGMQPLDNDHTHRYLGGHRVRDVARRFGRDINDATAYHAAPHPFP